MQKYKRKYVYGYYVPVFDLLDSPTNTPHAGDPICDIIGVDFVEPFRVRGYIESFHPELRWLHVGLFRRCPIKRLPKYAVIDELATRNSVIERFWEVIDEGDKYDLWKYWMRFCNRRPPDFEKSKYLASCKLEYFPAGAILRECHTEWNMKQPSKYFASE